MILGMYFKLNFVWILQWFCTKKTSNQIWPWVHSLNFQKLHGQSSQYIYSIPNFYLYVCIFNWIFLFLWISYRICNDFAQKRHPIRSDLGFARWTSKNCMVKAVFIYCYPTSRGATAHTPKLGFFTKKKTRTFAKSGNVLRPRAYVIKQIFKKNIHRRKSRSIPRSNTLNISKIWIRK